MKGLPMSKKILIMDDDPTIADLLREALADEGYETYMTTTFFGASCAPEATTSGLPKMERFHEPLGASHVQVTAKLPRNPTRTVAAGTPPATGCAPRYVPGSRERRFLLRPGSPGPGDPRRRSSSARNSTSPG